MQHKLPCDWLLVLAITFTPPTSTVAREEEEKESEEGCEIIELAWCLLDAMDEEVKVSQQGNFSCRPLKPPSETWLKIHGLGEGEMDLQEALERLHKVVKDKDFCFCVHQARDLKARLVKEAQDKELRLPSSFIDGGKIFDVRVEVAKWLAWHPEISLFSDSLKSIALALRCTSFQEGRGAQIECANLREIVLSLLRLNHGGIFLKPTEIALEKELFYQEKSRVVHLASLPFNLTYKELEQWFCSPPPTNITYTRENATSSASSSSVAKKKLIPEKLWMVRASDGRPSGTGFAIAANHKEAALMLEMNGCLLNRRVIEVSPSSEKIIDQASSILSLFAGAPGSAAASSQPHYGGLGARGGIVGGGGGAGGGGGSGMASSMGAPTPGGIMRTGDWICTQCRFHNFASRRFCFKCTAQAPANAGPAAIAASMHPGDWICVNVQCNFHNYASRLQCLRCGCLRPGTGADLAAAAAGAYATPHQPRLEYHHHHAQIAAPPVQQPQQPMGFRPGDWTCGTCSFQNFASRVSCMRCGIQTEGGEARLKPGDWICRGCGYHNFAKRSQCGRCGLENVL